MGNVRRRARALGVVGLLVAVMALLPACQPLKPGALEGTVRDRTGAPLAGVLVAAYPAGSTASVATASTAADGSYEIEALPGGQYRIGITDPGGVYRDYFHATARSLAAAAPVTVDGATAVVDAVLSTAADAATIRGAVTAASTPRPGIRVTLFNAAFGTPVASTTTAPDGSYAFGDLDPAGYKLGFTDPANVYAPQFGQGHALLADAEVVVVGPAAAVTADASLLPAGTIAGRVTDGRNGLADLFVVVMADDQPGWMRYTRTDATGAYSITGLAPGSTYVVSFADLAFYQDPTTGYRSATFGTPNRVDLTGAPRVTVTGGQITTADGALSGAACNPDTYHAGAALPDASLSGLHLGGCDLEGADLAAASAAGADLHAADLAGVDLRGADLTNADLTGADLAHADLTGAVITGARFSGATWDTTTCPDGSTVSAPASCARMAPVLQVTATPSTVVAGEPVAVSVVVAPDRAGDPTPTGTIKAVDWGTSVPLVDGAVSATIPTSSQGDYTIRFEYLGDDNYEPAYGSVQFTVSGISPFVGEGPTVAMAGDSITFWSKSAIENELTTGGYRRSVTGIQGVTTSSGQWIIDSYALTEPSVLIIDLGTNDASDITRNVPGMTIDSLQQRLLADVAKFPDSCVVVSTLSAHRDATWGPDYEQYNANARTIDTWIHATFPHVLDWEQAVSDAIDAGSPILSDGVHPNEAGTFVLARLAHQAADQCLAPPSAG